jgi:hypothetical protein
MKGIFSIIIIFLSQSLVLGQVDFRQWSEGKTGGIYLSRKEFSYSMEWLQMLNQFTRLGGDDIPREDLKLATLVRLGQLLETNLPSVVKDSRWIFLNEEPELSNVWMRVRGASTGDQKSMAAMPDSLDFIINVESLLLSAYSEKSVYSKSNRIHTDRRVVFTGALQIRVTDRQNNNMMAPMLLRINTDLDSMEKSALDFDNEVSPGGQYLSVLFSQLLSHPVR